MLKQVTLATLQQLATLLGWLFVMGLVLHILARTAQYLYMRALGPTAGVLITGWLGTPVHELGHAVFCPLFGHKIKKLRLWVPFSKDGSAGSVEHAWNRKSIYQNVGNLFIAAGPILLGSALILAGFYFLVPAKGAALAAIRSCSSSLWGPLARPDCLPAFFTLLFYPGSLASPLFWVFLYGSFCIASHMGLSFPDIKGCLWGAAFLAAVLLGVNTIVYLAGLSEWHTYILRFAASVREMSGILVFAVLMSFANFCLAAVLFAAGKLLGWIGRG
jgi:hypothetical protein